jgi:hypothetical protein
MEVSNPSGAENSSNPPEGQSMQGLPAPWCVEKIAGGFRVRDRDGRPIVWVFGQENPIRPDAMTLDQADEMALTIATLPEILSESEDFHVKAASLQQAVA